MTWRIRGVRSEAGEDSCFTCGLTRDAGLKSYKKGVIGAFLGYWIKIRLCGQTRRTCMRHCTTSHRTHRLDKVFS